MTPLAAALQTAIEKVEVCRTCGNIDSQNPCTVCTDPRRDPSVIVVVADVADLWALERAEGLNARYHVLGGTLSPLDGIGPQDLTIDALVSRAHDPAVKEIILALNATVDGQTTAHYITDLLHDADVIGPGSPTACRSAANSTISTKEPCRRRSAAGRRFKVQSSFACESFGESRYSDKILLQGCNLENWHVLDHRRSVLDRFPDCRRRRRDRACGAELVHRVGLKKAELHDPARRPRSSGPNGSAAVWRSSRCRAGRRQQRRQHPVRGARGPPQDAQLLTVESWQHGQVRRTYSVRRRATTPRRGH